MKFSHRAEKGFFRRCLLIFHLLLIVFREAENRNKEKKKSAWVKGKKSIETEKIYEMWNWQTNSIGRWNVKIESNDKVVYQMWNRQDSNLHLIFRNTNFTIDFFFFFSSLCKVAVFPLKKFSPDPIFISPNVECFFWLTFKCPSWKTKVMPI